MGTKSLAVTLSCFVLIFVISELLHTVVPYYVMRIACGTRLLFAVFVRNPTRDSFSPSLHLSLSLYLSLPLHLSPPPPLPLSLLSPLPSLSLPSPLSPPPLPLPLSLLSLSPPPLSLSPPPLPLSPLSPLPPLSLPLPPPSPLSLPSISISLSLPLSLFIILFVVFASCHQRLCLFHRNSRWVYSSISSLRIVCGFPLLSYPSVIFTNMLFSSLHSIGVSTPCACIFPLIVPLPSCSSVMPSEMALTGKLNTLCVRTILLLAKPLHPLFMLEMWFH